jgi:hypothetical protein
VFSPEQFHIVVYERLISDTSGELSQIFQWLDLDDWPSAAESAPANVGSPAASRSRFLRYCLNQIQSQERYWCTLRQLVPKPVKGFLTSRASRDGVNRSQLFSLSLIARLEQMEQRLIEDFEELTNSSVPEWRPS